MSTSSAGSRTERILVFPFGLMSHYLRCLELMKHFPDAEISFASCEPYDHFVSERGCNTFLVESFDPKTVLELATRFDFSWLNAADIERVFRSQVEIIQKLKPHRIIGDTSPTLRMASEFTRVPYTALMNGYMSPFYDGIRELPLDHPGNRYLEKVPSPVRKCIIRFAERLTFWIIHRPFKRVRRKYSLSYKTNYLQETQADENLICDHAWLFPQRNLPSNYKVIGPLIFESEKKETESLPGLSADKKKIIVCLGSSGDWSSVQFLSSEEYSRYQVITAGDTLHTICGPHVLAFPFVPLGAILPKCALLICHGGNGTIYHGLKHNVPMFCLTSHFEQEYNARRLAELGFAKWINANPKKFVDEFLEGGER